MCSSRLSVGGFSLALASGALQSLLVLAPSPARSDVYVIPHVLEIEGRTNVLPYTFDHHLFALYGAGLGGTPFGTGAVLRLYLYDNSAGNPMQTFGQDVCNPCTFLIGGEYPRKATVHIEDLIDARGGFDTPVKLGTGVLVVEGDSENATFQSNIVNSHSNALDLSILSFPPPRLRSEDPGAPGATVFQLAHVHEVSGRIYEAPFTFDQTIFATYTAGLAGTPAGAGATLDVYLYDNTGDVPLQNQGLDVCNPCTFALGGGGPRKQVINIEELILARGVFDTAIKLGAAVLVVTGDAGNVTLQAFSLNALTGALDLNLYLPPLQPVSVDGSVGVLLGPRPGIVAGLSAGPVPSAAAIRFAFEMTRPADARIALYDVTGRKVATVFQGHSQAGPNEVVWDGTSQGRRLAGGIYFARLSAEDGSSVARVVMRP
jgi:hypothetical protein